MKIELSLGSNTHSEENIQRAKMLLRNIFTDILFDQMVWTEPYPTPTVPHPTKKYLNCTAHANTPLGKEQVIEELKNVERMMGDSHSNHQIGIVLIDIDLLMYDGQKVKEKRW